jgi:hypothetical protein
VNASTCLDGSDDAELVGVGVAQGGLPCGYGWRLLIKEIETYGGLHHRDAHEH